MNVKSIVIALLLSLSSATAFSTVSAYHTGKITQIGYEAGRGIMQISSGFSEAGCTGVYADLSDAVQRTAYATALTAKAEDKTVRIRFQTDGTNYYANCPVFEITIMD